MRPLNFKTLIIPWFNELGLNPFYCQNVFLLAQNETFMTSLAFMPSIHCLASCPNVFLQLQNETFITSLVLCLPSLALLGLPKRFPLYRMRHSWLPSLACLVWHILTHPDTSWHILRHLDTSWCILTHPDTSWHILTHPDISWHILKHLIFTLFTLFTLYPDTSWHILTHGV